MIWYPQQITGETGGDFYDRIENGVTVWKGRKGQPGPFEPSWKINGVDDLPEWVDQIVTYKLQVGQYAGRHPEKGVIAVVVDK